MIQRRVATRDGDRTLSLRVLPYRLQNGSVDGATLVLTDITEALSLERQLAAERERLELAVKAGGIGVWEYSPDAGTVVVDSTAGTIFGLTPDTPHPTAALAASVLPEDRPGFEAALAEAAHGLDEFEARIRVRAADHALRHIRSYGRLTRSGDRKRIVGVCIDVSPEYALAETRDLMLREMNHRVKNLFAIIGGMISAGARTHREIGVFATDMRDRISALGRAHSLADPSDGQGMSDLAGLIGATLRPYRDHVPTVIEGPLVAINWRHVSSSGDDPARMGDELGEIRRARVRRRRAVRHLGPPGRGARPRMVRAHGPRGRTAAGPGFGTLLVEMSLRQLEATVTRSHDASAYRITLHLPELALTRGEARADPSATGRTLAAARRTHPCRQRGFRTGRGSPRPCGRGTG